MTSRPLPPRLPLAAVALAAVAAGWLAGTLLPIPLSRSSAHSAAAAAGSSDVRPSSSVLPPSVPFALPVSAAVPDVRQSTGYTCGAAALQAVLAYWGISEREDRLAARLGTSPEAGTHPRDIVRVAREFGLQADLREGLALPDLEAALSSGTTVIVDLQAWRARADLPWTETWDDGHYMVLLGMDAQNLYFEDPSLLGRRGLIPRAEFVDRWHDYEGEPPLDPADRRYVHMALFLEGSRPPSGGEPLFEPVL